MDISVNARSTLLSPGFRFDIKRRLGRMYNKASHSIRQIKVSLEDVNGPKGGNDKQCKMQLTLFGYPPILIVTQKDTVEKAFVEAQKRANRTLFKKLKKHQRIDKNTAKLASADLTEQ